MGLIVLVCLSLARTRVLLAIKYKVEVLLYSVRFVITSNERKLPDLGNVKVRSPAVYNFIAE